MAIYMIKSAPNSNSTVVSFKHDDVWDDLFAIGLQDLSLGYEMDVNLTPNVIASQFRYYGINPTAATATKARLLDLSENSSYSPPIALFGVDSSYVLRDGFPAAGKAIAYPAGHIDNPLLGYISVIYDVTLCGDQGVWGVMDGTGTGTTVTEAYVELTTPDILYGQLSHCYNFLNGLTDNEVIAQTDQNVMRGLLGLPLRNVNTHDWGCGTGRNNPTPKPKKKCFPSSTPVLTPTGWMRIAKLQVGDPVISYQSATGQMRVRRVTKRVDHAPTQIWEINIQGTAIPVSTTECHPFLTRRGWVFASRLKPGDELISIGRSGHQYVASACRTDRVEPVHNLFTTGEHTFVVQGYVVHNFAYLRNLRSLWHRLFVDWKVESMKTRNRTEEHPASFGTGSS